MASAIAPLAPSSSVRHKLVDSSTDAAPRNTISAAASPKRGQQSSTPSAPSGSGFSPAAAAPPRAPLPTRQPPRPTASTPARPPSARTSSSAKPAPVKPSAAPPVALPRLSAPPVDKMAMAAVISPNPMQEMPKMSMTSKEWVIPPRPKPGRKPATDTPPTKRKAQNRAAQRAFRERRAARVGELEELLDQQKETQDKHEGDLKEKIHDLELDVQSFRSRCMLLENMLERERQERIRTETEAETLRRRLGEGHYRTQSLSTHHHQYERMQSPIHPHHQQQQQQQQQQQRHSVPESRQSQPPTSRNISISQIITPPETNAGSLSDVSNDALTCGNCTITSRCACADEVLASVAGGCGKCGFGAACQCLDEVAKDLKRPVSPSGHNSDQKRHRPSVMAPAETEVDMTTFFPRKTSTVSPLSYQPAPIVTDMPSGDSMAFRDDCGFCKDGTYCVCADAAMATPAMTPTETGPAVSHQTQTPPPESDPTAIAPPIPMEMTAEGAVKLPPRKNKKKNLLSGAADADVPRGCATTGPGTCAQCQADPKSGLFCRLMAANFGKEGGPSSGPSSGPSGGCCGGKGAGGGCCKSGPKQEPEKITLPSLPSLGLSCAEAYQTLASHRNFEKAADDITSWLPKLRAAPNGSTRATAPSMMPIEVEAASIMSVLKEFDVRFARDC